MKVKKNEKKKVRQKGAVVRYSSVVIVDRGGGFSR
jgi:hypothetical protein